MRKTINLAAKNLANARYRKRIVRPRKGKGSYHRKDKYPTKEA